MSEEATTLYASFRLWAWYNLWICYFHLGYGPDITLWICYFHLGYGPDIILWICWLSSGKEMKYCMGQIDSY